MKQFLSFIFIFVLLIFTGCSDRSSNKKTNTDSINGKAVDNYLKNATVCIDTTLDNSCDDESTANKTTTDANGNYTFSGITATESMVIIAYGGTDIKTNEPFPYILKNIATNVDSNNDVILSSLTTLVSDYKQSSGSTLDEAKTAVATFLGGDDDNITSSTVSVDVIALKDSEEEEFLRSLKIFQMIKKINEDANVSNDHTQSAKSFAALATAIKNDINSTLRHNTATINVELDTTTYNAAVANTSPVLLDLPAPEIASGSKKVLTLDFVVDPDKDNITYSLNDTNSSNIFEIINGNELWFNSLPIYDANGTNDYNVTLKATDGVNDIIKVISVSVVEADSNVTAQAPTNITLSSTSIDENNAANSAIGTLSTQDIDSDAFTYTLVAGDGDTDNSSFSINGSELQIVDVADFETKSSYSVRINSNDGENDFAKSFTITINDVSENVVVPNLAPTNVILSSSTIADSNEINATVGTLSTTDSDDTSWTYSLVSGNGDDNNSLFFIDGDSLKIKISTDYNSVSSYKVRIETKDDSNDTFSKSFDINVTQNGAPTDLSLSATTIAENNEINATIGTFNTTDSDDTSWTYSLVSGSGDTDNASFFVDGNSLKIKISTDYETKTTYSVRVETKDDSNNSFAKSFDINITDVNENRAPVFTNLSSVNVAENTIAVITLSATDEDNDTVTFDINNTTLFNISSGVVTFKVAPDYESDPISYTLLATASDGTAQVNQVITISITNDTNEGGNDAATDIFLDSNNSVNFYFDENNNINDTVAIVSANDPDDPDNNLTYSVSGGADQAKFGITNHNQLYINEVANFENKSTYAIRIQVQDDDGASYAKDFTININDKNDVATFSKPETNQTIVQNATFNFDINATDVDAGQTLTKSTEVVPFGAFSYQDNNTNNVKFNITGTPDDSLVGNHTFTIRVIENNTSATIEHTFDLNVTDVNDAPKITAISVQDGASYDENNYTSYTDQNVSFEETQRISFTINDGDAFASSTQDITINVTSGNTSIATVAKDLSTINNSGTFNIDVIGVSTGDTNITVELVDDENNTASGVDTTTFSFDVKIRSNGWKIYHDRTNDTNGHTVAFDDRTYTWSASNRWYQDNTNNTILVPVKIIKTTQYESPNVVNYKEGHYYVNQNNYINHVRISEDNQHLATDTYDVVSGSAIVAHNKNFQHDPVHNLFVSRVLGNTQGDGYEALVYADWTDINSTDGNGTVYSNALDENTTFTTDINMSSGYASTSVIIDYNNDGNVTDSLCAQQYGEGWRLPTSYEAGVNISHGDLYKGFIPAYVGHESADIYTSTQYDGNNQWIIKSNSGYSRSGGLTQTKSARCVYHP